MISRCQKTTGALVLCMAALVMAPKPLAASSSNIPAAASNIRGYIDGIVVTKSGQYILEGWACVTGRDAPITVDLYAGSATGAKIGTYPANVPSGAAVAAACNSHGARYRYQIPLAPATLRNYGGQPIYVNGVSPTGGAAALMKSGTYSVPEYVTQGSGSCGPANGLALTSPPSETELCATGTASPVTGSNPWSWSCSGSNGGASASCATLFKWQYVTVGASSSLLGPGVQMEDFILQPVPISPYRPVNAPLFEGWASQWFGYTADTTSALAQQLGFPLYHPILMNYGTALKMQMQGNFVVSDSRNNLYAVNAAGATQALAPSQAGLYSNTLSNIAQMPFYPIYNRDDPKWWDEVLDEFLYARVPVIMMASIGCYHPDNLSDLSGPGNNCGHVLMPRDGKPGLLEAALNRAGAHNTARFGLFIDAPAVAYIRPHLYADAKIPYPQIDDPTNPGTLTNDAFDMSDTPDALGHKPSWYFFYGVIKPFFDAVPQHLWYLYNDNGVWKPIVAFWTILDTYNAKGQPQGRQHYKNTQGNIALMLEEVRALFQQTYGMAPFFNLMDDSVYRNDTSLQSKPALVGSIDNWFNCAQDLPYSVTRWNGKNWGALVPSFDCMTKGPVACYNQTMPSLNGQSFIAGFEANRASALNIIEGIDDIGEGNASMRSDDVRDPAIAYPYANRYLDIVREYSDPETATIKFQAEAADLYADSAGNEVQGKDAPVPFRYGKKWGIVGLGANDGNSGWALGETKAGESILYRNIYLANGFYKFTARVSSATAGGRLHFSIDGVDLPSQPVPNTGNRDVYAVIMLGETFVPAGHHDLQIVFESDGVNLDWFFSNKLWPQAGGQQSLPLPTDSIGASAGTTIAGLGQLLASKGFEGVNVATLTPANGGAAFVNVGLVSPVDIGGHIFNGQSVALVFPTGRFMGQNGRGLAANRTSPTASDIFTIYKLYGDPNTPIASGDTVALRSANGVYVSFMQNGAKPTEATITFNAVNTPTMTSTVPPPPRQ